MEGYRKRDGSVASKGQQFEVIRVIVASPGDVATERKYVSDTVDEVNRTHAHPNGFHIDVWKWETDAHPEFHVEGAQGVIDEQMTIQGVYERAAAARERLARLCQTEPE
jgi:hypothetical protein